MHLLLTPFANLYIAAGFLIFFQIWIIHIVHAIEEFDYIIIQLSVKFGILFYFFYIIFTAKLN